MLQMTQRREIVKLAALSAFAAPFGLAGDKRLTDSVVQANKAQITHQPFGDVTVFFEGPTSYMKSITAGSLKLKPGMEPHPPHQHPEEEFMIVTEGAGDILVNGQTVRVGPGSMMYCEANQLHGVKNTGDVPLLFYYYKFLV
jgi:mannose-6-phosphate isomerase-like protein (cupin superfamily)